jgi:COX assembly mitochondrial protein 2
MHPSLSEHLHPGCEEAIRGLTDCHAEHPLRKFIGTCNQAKYALDTCFRDEFLVRRELNAQKAKQAQQRLKNLLRENGLS